MADTYNGDPYEGLSQDAADSVYRHVNDLCEGCELCQLEHDVDEGGEA